MGGIVFHNTAGQLPTKTHVRKSWASNKRTKCCGETVLARMSRVDMPGVTGCAGDSMSIKSATQ